MPRLLVDNDVLIKLAHWGLLDHFLTAFGVMWPEVAAPPSLLFRAQRADRKLFRDAGIAAQLSERLAMAAAVEPDPLVVEALQGIAGLDAGEILLIAALANTPGAVLVTGDKRALTALAEPSLAWLHDRLRGRLYCLEQALARIAAVHGSDVVVDGIDRYRDLDMAARCAVGTTRPMQPALLAAALESYVADLRVQCAGMLAH